MTWLKDTVERVIRTFLQSWLGAWLAVAGALDLEDASTKLEGPFFNMFAEAYLLAGLIGAVGALLTCLAARERGGDNASLQKVA